MHASVKGSNCKVPNLGPIEAANAAITFEDLKFVHRFPDLCNVNEAWRCSAEKPICNPTLRQGLLSPGIGRLFSNMISLRVFISLNTIPSSQSWPHLPHHRRPIAIPWQLIGQADACISIYWHFDLNFQDLIRISSN